MSNFDAVPMDEAFHDQVGFDNTPGGHFPDSCQEVSGQSKSCAHNTKPEREQLSAEMCFVDTDPELNSQKRDLKQSKHNSEDFSGLHEQTVNLNDLHQQHQQMMDKDLQHHQHMLDKELTKMRREGISKEKNQTSKTVPADCGGKDDNRVSGDWRDSPESNTTTEMKHRGHEDVKNETGRRVRTSSQELSSTDDLVNIRRTPDTSFASHDDCSSSPQDDDNDDDETQKAREFIAKKNSLFNSRELGMSEKLGVDVGSSRSSVPPENIRDYARPSSEERTNLTEERKAVANDDDAQTKYGRKLQDAKSKNKDVAACTLSEMSDKSSESNTKSSKAKTSKADIIDSIINNSLQDIQRRRGPTAGNLKIRPNTENNRTGGSGREADDADC